MYPPLRFSTIVMLAAAGPLLGSCSQQGPATTAAPAASPAAPTPPKFPYGAKVDSLNGLAGHPFGQPLSAFPKLKPVVQEPGTLTQCFLAPDGIAGPWFARHRAQLPYQYVYFLDGQFCQFRAVGEPATLKAEAEYLFGPGLVQWPLVLWQGERARAVYGEQAVGLGRQGTLDILSKPLEAVQQAKAQARLKAENGQ